MLKRLFIVLIICLVVVTQVHPYVYSQTDQERLLDLQREQKDLQDKINNAQKSIKTLNGQITLMEDQIRLTSLKITDAEKKIKDLETQIEDKSRSITRVNDLYSSLQETLLTRVRATYAIGRPSTMQLVMSSEGFSDALTSYHYLEILQKNDLKLLAEMERTHQNYTEQKISLEDRQTKLEEAKAELDKQTQLLAQQRKDKEQLLSATKNDEKRFQQMLAQSRAEANAIEAAIANSFNLKDGVKVKKGDVIALMGNSGAPSCSTGAHLHFEVRENGSLRDPSSYLKSTSLGYGDDHVDRINGSGSWDWPMSDPVITQGYGMTYWARTGFYGGGPHTGIDMISHASAAIRAVSDGTLYKTAMKCGSSTLKYAVLDHGNGIRTYYLHIQ